MDYKGPVEVALSTDLRGEPYNFSLWDIQTGAQLIAFKGIKSSPIAKCLQLIDNNYFITANDNLLHIWSIFNRKSQDQKLFLPSRPSSLCISPCAQFLIAGLNEVIYVWQLKSGNLVAHVQRHYQPITVLKMNQDGSLLFSAGEDGMVLVWSFADLVSGTYHTSSLNLSQSKRDIGANEPRFTWQHHSGTVSDLHLTNGGRCLTASLDQTMNIYDCASGRRLFSIMMPTPITCIVMDRNETTIFLGGQDGKVYEVLVSSLSLSLLNSKKEDDKKPVFAGHQAKIVSLVISRDSTRLISASQDSSCKIWDIRQKKLLQDIKHQAPLANLKSLLIPDGFSLTSMSKTTVKPPLIYKPLKRNLFKFPRHAKISKDDLFDENSVVILHIRNETNAWEAIENHSHITNDARPYDGLSRCRRQTHAAIKDTFPESESASDGQMIRNLKRKLQELYTYSAEKIFKDAAGDSYLSSFKDTAFK